MVKPTERLDYINSGVWKCKDSPTSAHHWIDSKGGGNFVCKHCKAARRFGPRETYKKVTPKCSAS